MNPPSIRTASRTFALAGPGRAGTSLALALTSRGWRAVGVTGRTPHARSTRAAVARLAAEPRSPAELGRGAALVLVATPDGAIGDTAAALVPGLEPGALVVHCSGARGLEALDAIRGARPDVEIGALHPLQTLTAPDPTRLVGAWAAVAGPGEVADLALELGLRPFVVSDDRRATYHAAAALAANHVVALLGQVTRLADVAGVPVEAFWPLVQAAVANVEEHGAAAALTGPVARGDVATVVAHIDAIPPSEREAYVALARAALTLAEHDDPALRAALDRALGEVLA